MQMSEERGLRIGILDALVVCPVSYPGKEKVSSNVNKL